MDIEQPTGELIDFFKALADANRLKILGLLAQDGYSVEQLAALLELRPSTVSHHLARLSEAGLVNARAESYYNVYSLEAGALEAMAQRLLAEDTLPALAEGVDMQSYERKVIDDYTLPGGRLKTIPAQRKKLEVVLQHIVQDFEPGTHYSEAQINAILSAYHDDTATLRRELVGYRLLERNAGEYWRPEYEHPE